MVTLWKDGKHKDWLVARLVCTTFHGTVNENLSIKQRMTVNHKDGNRFNNNIENIEWLTIGDNIRHAFENGLMHTQKRICLINIETQYGQIFKSYAEASRYLGKNHGYVSDRIIKHKNTFTDTEGTQYELFSKED